MLHDYLIAKTKGKALDENIILYKDYRITILKDRLFRIEKSLDNNFCDLPSTAVWYRDLPLVSYKKEIKDGSLFINTDKVTLVINDEIENSYVIIDNKIISLNNDDNLLGTATGLDGCLGNVNTEYAKTPTPIVMENGVCSKTGVAIIDDSNTKLFAENGLIIERKHEVKDIYVFAYGNEYQASVKAFYEITGKAPLIPRFAFGIWWSRFHDYSDERARWDGVRYAATASLNPLISLSIAGL